MAAPDILFLFKGGRRARLGEVGPREFFYGFTEMPSLGLAADLLEETELSPATPWGPFERLATALLDPLAGLNAATLARFGTGHALDRLNRASAIVATTNAQGLVLGALKALGRLGPPVLFRAMGVWPLETSVWRRMFLKRWLQPLALAPMGRPDADWLRRRMPEANLAYLPFGVDAGFWTHGDATGARVLAIGNDPHRDWETLVKAWTPSLPPLDIVTRRPVPSSASDIAVIAGDWQSRPLSDEAIRDLYRQARFVVLPLRQTIQPSGQSACLQAMACGKAVILSAIDGLWDGDVLTDGETCLLVPPGDAAALADAAARLAGDPALARRIGHAARERLLGRFTIECTGRLLADRLGSLIQERGARR